jgi:hypothetical protein
MHLLAERFVFGVMIGVFWKRESRPVKRHECRLLTCQLLFCLHIYSLLWEQACERSGVLVKGLFLSGPARYAASSCYLGMKHNFPRECFSLIRSIRKSFRPWCWLGGLSGTGQTVEWPGSSIKAKTNSRPLWAAEKTNRKEKRQLFCSCASLKGGLVLRSCRPPFCRHTDQQYT